VVFLLERDEGVEVLERIIESCTTVDGQYLALMPPNKGLVGPDLSQTDLSRLLKKRKNN
jgi:hypothetical protein